MIETRLIDLAALSAASFIAGAVVATIVLVRAALR